MCERGRFMVRYRNVMGSRCGYQWGVREGGDCTWDDRDDTCRKKRNPFSFHAIVPADIPLVTLTAHFMTSAVSSDTTRSTHLRLGSLSLRICFLTIASKARSGVKSPVLNRHGVQSAFCCGGGSIGKAEKTERVGGKERG